jgi:GTP-binding protein
MSAAIRHYAGSFAPGKLRRTPTHFICTSQARYTQQVKSFHAKFLKSAMAAEHFPKPGPPEVAFLGRSNVGKSSLINALLGEKQAHVSSTPGRTRAINFFALADAPWREKPEQRPQLVLADLPGYGYAKISKSVSAEWPKFIEPYLRDRTTLALCVCLVDATIPPKASDAQLIEFLESAGRDFVVVGTKADRLSGNGRAQAVVALAEAFGRERLLLVSAKTGSGMKELWGRIREQAMTANQ